MRFQTQMFLITDSELPEHINKTFKLRPDRKSDLFGVEVALMGDEINLKATGYVIVFADNEWHGAKAYDLYHQIKGLRSDAAVMVLPVDVNAADEDPFLVRGHGSIFTIPQIP